MTYDVRERSADQARPVELYEFRRGDFVWRYTTADRDYTQDFQVYQRAAIRRSGIEQGAELNRSNLRLTLDGGLAVMDQYRAGNTADPVALTLRQVHEGSTEAVALWVGRVLSVSVWRGGQSEMVLEPVYTSVRRNGLRRAYIKGCPHVLYGGGCKLNAAAWRQEGIAAGISGTAVTVAAAATYPVGYFDGGVLEWQVGPATWERRFIVGHTGASLTLSTQPLGLEFGGAVRLLPGCDHTLATCDSKFSNSANYGGMPYIPRQNPYGSDPLY
jgi:uncharacterized phage protein (TIGR02218 family)